MRVRFHGAFKSQAKATAKKRRLKGATVLHRKSRFIVITKGAARKKARRHR